MEEDTKEAEAKEKKKEEELEEKKRDKEEEEEEKLVKRKLLFGYKEPKYYSQRMSRYCNVKLYTVQCCTVHLQYSTVHCQIYTIHNTLYSTVQYSALKS